MLREERVHHPNDVGKFMSAILIVAMMMMIIVIIIIIIIMAIS